MIKNFGITEFPTLLVLTETGSYSGERYSGEIKVD